jgi:aminoglycoside phosphotransferase (APT) family kinase protein
MLTRETVGPYLRERALLGEDANGPRVEDRSARNRVFVAHTGAGSGYVVKACVPGDAALLAREAAVLARLDGAGGVAPQRVLFDRGRGVLVTRLVGTGQDLAEHQLRRGCSAVLARAAGRALAGLHQLPPEALGDVAGAHPPLSLPPDPAPATLVWESSGAGVEFMRLAQRATELVDRLAGVEAAWRPDAVVHGDVRWANWVPYAPPHSRRRTRVALVDWELAQPGEAAFDLGSMLADYLVAWVTSIAVADPGDLARYAVRPLARMQPAMRGFWDAYVAACDRRPSVRRVVECAAARVVQYAWERTASQARLEPIAGPLLQLSLGMLRRPAEAAVRVLGLPLAGAVR